jgi:hypothetical protein
LPRFAPAFLDGIFASHFKVLGMFPHVYLPPCSPGRKKCGPTASFSACRSAFSAGANTDAVSFG